MSDNPLKMLYIFFVVVWVIQYITKTRIVRTSQIPIYIFSYTRFFFYASIPRFYICRISIYDVFWGQQVHAFFLRASFAPKKLLWQGVRVRMNEWVHSYDKDPASHCRGRLYRTNEYFIKVRIIWLRDALATISNRFGDINNCYLHAGASFSLGNTLSY